jgi:hypothetical protein
MDDAVIVRRLERLADLPRDRPHLVERQRAVNETIRERQALDQLEDERARAAARLLESVDRRDVRMVQRGKDLRFTPESREAIGVERERIGQHFQATSRARLVSRARYTSPIRRCR